MPNPKTIQKIRGYLKTLEIKELYDVLDHTTEEIQRKEDKCQTN